MLTAIQKKIYDYIKDFIKSGYPPSVREICHATGLKSTSSVHANLKSLEKKGLIIRTSGLNRAIQLTENITYNQIPIIDGFESNNLKISINDVKGYIPYKPAKGSINDYFALRIHGESMKQAGILDDDIAVIYHTPEAKNGELVAAVINHKTTIKKFYIEKDCIRLQPENPEFAPIYSKNVEIIGKVVAIFRNYLNN